MKAVLSLTNPMWNSPQRKQLLDRVVQKSAAELEGEIKQKILNSSPRGKLYRRGSKFHRASAPGQPPASDTGSLLNSIRASKIELLKARVSVGVKYGEPLDKGAVAINNRNSPTKIVGPLRNRTIAPRPFFAVTAQKFKEKFKQNIKDAIAANS